MRNALQLALVILAATLPLRAADWDAPPAAQTAGQFWRLHWYERGLENGNPSYDKRFRVNSPEVSLHPTFGKRVEARENGMMLILAEEDLFQAAGADLCLEMWGGHPGTANKRVTLNGRNTYALPKVGIEEGFCAYSYPTLPLRLTDLVNGYNAFQFACDQGTTFWGHMIVDNACLRVALKPGHPDFKKLKLQEFSATVKAAKADAETIRLSLPVDQSFASRIASVDFQGHYDGYDENGDRRGHDWHGFTKSRRPVAILGSAAQPPFEISWDTSMLPSQKNVAVRAVVRFKDSAEIAYLTSATTGIEIPDRPGIRVELLSSDEPPKPFWSRAGKKRASMFWMGVDPQRIQRAELHVNAWRGGPGTVKEYFKLNGRHFPVADGSAHDLLYSRLPVDPAVLKQGENWVELLSDTEHHGIEILLPGPAVMIRYKTTP